MNRRPLAIAAVVLAVAAGCGSSGAERADPPPTTLGAEQEGIARLGIEVVAVHPHDTGAYTQGLLLDDGAFFESTGQYGASDLREVDVASGEPSREVALPASYFGEGLTLVDDRLIQLTWKEQVARVYDRDTFELVDEHVYEGEGWGICLEDDRLVMSDGTSTLTFRDPTTFEENGTVDVTANGASVEALNELECVDGTVYANVYRTDEIVAIDPATGEVTASIDASSLRDELDGTTGQVLNGIAHDRGTGHFFLTGKYWPDVFEVRFTQPEG